MTLPQIHHLTAEELLERFNQQESRVAQQQVEIDEQKVEIAQLLAQIEYLKRKLYGSGDGESTDKLQMELSELLSKLDPEVVQAPEPDVEVPEQPVQRRARKPLKPRSERFAHLPIQETVEILPEQVQAAPDDYERIEIDEQTFEIDYERPKFFRRVILRPKFRRKAAGGTEPPVVAPAPVRVSGGLASSHLIALILVAKYWDHLPLYRQVRQYKRYGCELALESMVRWVAKAGEWLDPIHQRMRWELLQGDYIQVDETPIDFCDPDAGLKRTRKGYLCGMSSPGQSVVFDWRKSRSHEAVTRSLQGFEGLLQADAYQAYGNYLEHGEVQIDNNLMENCIRPTKIGAKNWLFIGHPNAGQRSAIIYSVLISCRRLGVDPDDYLTEVFQTDTATATEQQIAELTPQAFANRKLVES